MSAEELQRRFTTVLAALRSIREIDHAVDMTDAVRVAAMSRIAGDAIRAAIGKAVQS